MVLVSFGLSLLSLAFYFVWFLLVASSSPLYSIALSQNHLLASLIKVNWLDYSLDRSF